MTTTRVDETTRTRFYSAEEVRTVSTSTTIEARRSRDAPRWKLTSGQVAARAYKMIAAGSDWRALVVELEIIPELARSLLDSWKGPEDLLLSKRDCEALKSYGFTDSQGALTGSSILANVERLRGDLRALRQSDVKRREIATPIPRE